MIDFNYIIKSIRYIKHLNYCKIYNPYYYEQEIDNYNSIIKMLNSNDIDIDYYIKLINNNDSKYRRIKKRVKKMLLSGQCWFCTYTLNDDSLSYDHVRKLKELLKENHYILNIDYGKKTNRLHYHGIVCSNTMPVIWDYGFCKFEKINTKNYDSICRYINKLTAHALKKSASTLIYSRKKL